MACLFLANTAYVTGEYQYNESTVKIKEKSNPCKVMIVSKDPPCKPDRLCDCKAARQQRDEVIRMLKKIERLIKKRRKDSVDVKYESKYSTSIYISDLCHCYGIKITDYRLKWYSLQGKPYLKIQWHYSLRYDDQYGRRKCYAGKMQKRIYDLPVRPYAGCQLEHIQYDYKKESKSQINIKVSMMISNKG